MYAALGIAATGLAGQPSVTIGDSYLLPSIAAVVVGGTLLGGGAGTIVGTVLGTLFMTQLDSLTLSLKAPTSVQYVVQAIVIIAAMALYAWRPRFWKIHLRSREVVST
jgi:ribose transport system permease protein